MSSDTNTPVINLYQARATLSPRETLTNLARDCDVLGVTAADVYGDFPATAATSSLRAFEAEVASYLGKEDAMFLPSGVMAQNIVLAISRGKGNSRFLCHHTSHLLLHEHNAYQELLQMEALVVGEEEKDAEIRDAMRFDSVLTTLTQNNSSTPTTNKPGVILLECPHREVGGKVTPLSEIVQLSQYCRQENIHFHMDGARLWEALPHYTAEDTISIAEFTRHFDSLYISFYKGLGGLSGAMLVGEKEYIKEARIWLRRFGGNVFTLLPYHIAAWSGFRNNRDLMTGRMLRLKEVVRAVTEALKLEGTLQ